MKKLLAVLFVLAVLAPAAAMADDTLDVSGEYRVEYYNVSNSDYSDDDAAQLDYWDQRFRLQFKIKPADGVEAVLRGDFTEANWGRYGREHRPGASSSTEVTDLVDSNADNVVNYDELNASELETSTSVDDVIMIDKAYVSVNKGPINVTVGLQGWTLGDSFGYCNQDTGLAITYKGKPVTAKIGFVKEDEFAKDDETDASEDINHYFADVGFKLPVGAINVYYAMQKDDNGAEADEPTMMGAMFKGKAGIVNIKATLEMFGGDDGDGTDYVGMQLYGDVNAKLSDQLKVGAEIVYSDGTDDPNEDKISRMPNAASGYRQYLERGVMMGTVSDFRANGSGPDIFSVDESGQAGAYGIRPYVEFKVIPELTLLAWVGYAMGAEDVDTIDSVLMYSVGALWAMAPKTTLGLQYMAVDPDEDSDNPVEPETWSGIGAIMKVKF